MKYFATIYKYQAKSPEIDRVRPIHREFINNLKQEGKILGSGPFTDAEAGALIILCLDNEATVADAEIIMNEDPFYKEHAVDDRTIREWNPVINIFGH